MPRWATNEQSRGTRVPFAARSLHVHWPRAGWRMPSRSTLPAREVGLLLRGLFSQCRNRTNVKRQVKVCTGIRMNVPAKDVFSKGPISISLLLHVSFSRSFSFFIPQPFCLAYLVQRPAAKKKTGFRVEWGFFLYFCFIFFYFFIHIPPTVIGQFFSWFCHGRV